MAFRPLSLPNQLLVWLIAVFLAILSLGFFIVWLRTPLGPITIWLFLVLFSLTLLLAILLYRLLALRSLDYWVERDAVRILWADETITIPLDVIQTVEQMSVETNLESSWRQWPASWVRTWRPGRNLVVYATRPPAECLLVRTPQADFLISPDDAEGFVRAVAERQALGPARDLELTVEHSSLREHWLLHDHFAQFLLIFGLFLGLILLAYLVLRYPGLPETIPLHFDARGIPDRIGPRRGLLLIPAITLLIGFFDAAFGIALYERHRFAAYLLWASALVLQIAGLMILRNLLGLVIV